ncbi:universal stress protein [Janibacter limosus]|uniref:Universal stress protein n=1 Tax=Janibacter limosus TaxID=53458 RepID=A0A4P6MQ75_9MICO|nr:universal stress protein [Janibacter limosus]QBF44856.1 universal stress protein [Janibacter limosus]
MTGIPDRRSVLTHPKTAIGGGTVVAGYDESREATTALMWAARYADARGLPLTVAYAAWPTQPGTSAGVGAVEAKHVEDRAARVARRGAGRVAGLCPDLKVRGKGAVGNPAAELVMESSTASLLVVGRRAAMPADSLGSVSFALGAHARCPVVVVPGDSPHLVGPDHPVVVGVDGSASSDQAVTFAADAAAFAGAELLILSAWTPRAPEPWMSDCAGGLPGAHGGVPGSGHGAADEHVRSAVALVHELHPEVVTSKDVRHGPTASVLLEASASAGMLVVGSRGAGGFAGLMLGSVSRAALRQSEVPLAVVRTGAV